MARKTQIVGIAVPSLGQVHLMWTMGLMDTQWPLNCTKTVIPVYDYVGGEVAEMRNRAVQMALSIKNEKQEISHLAFLDDDVLPNRWWLVKLLGHNREVAAGCYFAKAEVAEPLIFPAAGNRTTTFVPDQLFETYGFSLGLSVIQMSVFERIRDELPLGVDKYGAPAWFHKPDVPTCEDGILSIGGTEDFHFFNQLEKLGIKPLVDTSKHTFGFHLDQKGKAYPRPQWEQYAKQQPVQWPLPGKTVLWLPDGSSKTEEVSLASEKRSSA